MQYDTSRSSLGEFDSFLTSVEKKGMKIETKMQKNEDWNLGNFYPKFSNYPPNYPSQTLQA